MNFYIIFESTGDCIPFETISQHTADVLVHYVDQLQKSDLNRFGVIGDFGKKCQQNLQGLDNTLKKCNEFIYELLDEYLETADLENYLDQKLLNKLHADWVHSQNKVYDIDKKRQLYQSVQSEQIHNMFPDELRFPIVATILDKIKCTDVYNKINLYVHSIENSFNQITCQALGTPWFETPNLFDKDLITNNHANFALSFNHLGRTLYDKFTSYDSELQFKDENNYDQLLGFVDIKLIRPQTIPFSKEFDAWAKSNQKKPIGQFFNIGNIVDLEKNLFDYRKVIYRNTLQQHAFSIKLFNKG
jgi:hypothetical protein